MINRGWQRGIISISLCFCMAGCSLAPHYFRPKLDTEPTQYKETDGWKPAAPQDEIPRGAWWTLFNDPELNALEDKVSSSNQDLKAALARFEQARAAADVARADYFPTVNGDAGVKREHISHRVATLSPVTLYNDYRLGADVSYEVDVWGRVRNAVAAGKDRAQASAADLAAMDLSLHSELATDYFILRGDDMSQAVLDEAVESFRKAFELTQHRHEGGVAAEADVAQAETQYQDARTQAAEMHLKRTQLEHAIAVLIGQPPAAFSLAAIPLDVSAKPVAVTTGLPSTLLERRPDIAAAERLTAAANAEIGVARAAWFPAFNLTGLFGFESATAADWLTAPARFWSIGPSAAQTLFDAGRISGLSEEARKAYDEAAANYRQTVLSAYQEVEDSLTAVRQVEIENETQSAATAAAQRALAQAKFRYEGGIVTYLEVVVAQTTALQARLSLVDIETRRMTNSVQLIKALGGGWQQQDIKAQMKQEAKPEVKTEEAKPEAKDGTQPAPADQPKHKWWFF